MYEITSDTDHEQTIKRNRGRLLTMTVLDN